MMDFLKYFLTAFMFCSLTIQAQSANNPIDSLNTNLFRSSNRYMENNIEYRVMKRSSLNNYFKNITSIDQTKTEQISTLQDKIIYLNDKIKQQEFDYSELNTKYEDQTKLNNGINFLGVIIPKLVYNLIMWTLIIGLSCIIAFLFILIGKNAKQIKSAKTSLTEKTDEFEAYRKRTLKKEQETAASYMRDINKLKEQLNK